MLPVVCLALSATGVERSHHVVLVAGVATALAGVALLSEARAEAPAESLTLGRSGVLRLLDPWR